MTNKLLKTIEKHFKFDVMDGVHPLRSTIMKHYPMFHSEMENNVLQLSNVLASHWIVIHL